MSSYRKTWTYDALLIIVSVLTMHNTWLRLNNGIMTVCFICFLPAGCFYSFVYGMYNMWQFLRVYLHLLLPQRGAGTKHLFMFVCNANAYRDQLKLTIDVLWVVGLDISSSGWMDRWIIFWLLILSLINHHLT